MIVGRTRPGISFIVTFLAVGTALIVGGAVTIVLMTQPQQQPSQSSSSSTSSSTSSSGSSDGRNPSVTAVLCSPSGLAVNAQTICTATVSDPGGPGSGLVLTGSVSFSTDSTGSFGNTTCAQAGGSQVCSATYVPSPGSEGSQTITARYSGDTQHPPSSGTSSLTAFQRPVSVDVSCSASASGSTSGSCTASVTDRGNGTSVAPTGKVSFSQNATGVINPSSCALTSGACSVSLNPGSSGTGVLAVMATYNGDRDHLSASATSAFPVGMRGASVSVTCGSSTVPIGVAVSCTALVTDISQGSPTTPTGSLTFFSNATGAFAPASCTLLSGGCSFTYTPKPGSAGVNIISAGYTGDSNHVSNSSQGPNSFSLSATKHGTNTILQCALQYVPVNSGVSCVVTVTDVVDAASIVPSGTAAISPSLTGTLSTLSCTLNSGSCTFTFTPSQGKEGLDSMNATYQGDANHLGSSAGTSLTATQRSVSVSVSCSPSSAPKGSIINCSATVSDTSPGNATSLPGTIAFSSGGQGFFNPVTCTPSNGSCTVSFTLPSTAGTVTVTATYSGDPDHSKGSGTAPEQVF